MKLLFACVWVGMHIAVLCCHLAEGRKHVTGFYSHAFERNMHRARAEAALPAFCRLGSFSPMEIHAHVLQGSFGSDSSAKTEGEKCWKAELLGRAQMDASAEWLPETPVPAASSLPLFSFPLGVSVLCCCFRSRSLCFPSLLILCFLLLLFSSVFLESCWHNQFSVFVELLRPSTLQGQEFIQPMLFLESKFQFECAYLSDLWWGTCYIWGGWQKDSKQTKKIRNRGSLMRKRPSRWAGFSLVNPTWRDPALILS